MSFSVEYIRISNRIVEYLFVSYWTEIFRKRFIFICVCIKKYCLCSYKFNKTREKSSSDTFVECTTIVMLVVIFHGKEKCLSNYVDFDWPENGMEKKRNRSDVNDFKTYWQQFTHLSSWPYFFRPSFFLSFVFLNVFFLFSNFSYRIRFKQNYKWCSEIVSFVIMFLLVNALKI